MQDSRPSFETHRIRDAPQDEVLPVARPLMGFARRLDPPYEARWLLPVNKPFRAKSVAASSAEGSNSSVYRDLARLSRLLWISSMGKTTASGANISRNIFARAIASITRVSARP
jgi:hypothetical protein